MLTSHKNLVSHPRLDRSSPWNFTIFSTLFTESLHEQTTLVGKKEKKKIRFFDFGQTSAKLETLRRDLSDGNLTLWKSKNDVTKNRWCGLAESNGISTNETKTTPCDLEVKVGGEGERGRTNEVRRARRRRIPYLAVILKFLLISNVKEILRLSPWSHSPSFPIQPPNLWHPSFRLRLQPISFP